MVKPLSFKGDKKVKKRKHKEDTTAGNNFMTALQSGGGGGDDSIEGEEETWTTADSPSDLSGPIMILLPSSRGQISSSNDGDDGAVHRHVCLASDSTGTVFSSPVENLIPDTPVQLSAEPSDVRQVWVVNKVPGDDSGWTLKSHQGRYLGVDRYGVVSCEKEAAGMEEVFWFVDAVSIAKEEEKVKGEYEDDDEDDKQEKKKLDGAFFLRTSRKTFLSTSDSAQGRSSTLANIRGDAEEPSARCILYVRMQSRFKPQLKASRELKAKEKISRKQLEEAVGRKLNEDEVRKLKKARRDGGWHEAVLDARVKGSHDKFA